MNTNKSSLSWGGDGSGVDTGLDVYYLLRKPRQTARAQRSKQELKLGEYPNCAVCLVCFYIRQTSRALNEQSGYERLS
jgi:hypothetical protein